MLPLFACAGVAAEPNPVAAMAAAVTTARARAAGVLHRALIGVSFSIMPIFATGMR
ncbi:MAG TPA: hypothetical protein VFT69_19025 [Pseudolabrys sp.]|nr:hypothetical protein [Pseudolabrys sp.]